MMNAIKMDKEIKNKISDLKNIPPGVKWNEEYGWNQYKRKYYPCFRRKFIHISVAATVLFGAIIISFLINNSTQSSIVELNTFGEQKKELTLSNGSKIWLNKNSYLRVDSKKNQIEINGEAYFELKNTEAYNIQFPHGTLKTNESVFNINSFEKNKEALITVEKGTVSVNWVADVRLVEFVSEGESVKIIPQFAIVKTAISDENFLAWKTGALHFNNSPLYSVIGKLEELHKIKIDVSEPDLRYCPVSFEMDSSNLEKVMNELEKQVNSRVEKIGNEYLIVGQGC